MFDVSLGELAVISAVALVVLGPEKLPKVARAAGLMLGRAQRMAAEFRADLERDLNNSELAELGKQMAEEEAKVREELSAVAAGAHQTLAEMETVHYAEPDPELEALEHRRLGGSDDDLTHQHQVAHQDEIHPYHDEVDPELQSLDLQRYGGTDVEFSPMETRIEDHASVPPGQEVVSSSRDPETGVAVGALAQVGKQETMAPDDGTPIQPDLFSPTAPVTPENTWRDRR